MDVDKSDMKGVLENFPQQIREALALAKGIKTDKKIDKIIITGMGGSALPGDILKAYLSDYNIPIFVNKDYFLPEFTNSKTLVFIISYSGNTEETIQSYRNALRKGAEIVVITSNGKLGKLCNKQKVNSIIVPKGVQPRLAYGYLFFSVLGVLQNSGLIDDKTKEIQKTIDTLKKPLFKERAEELAERLVDKIPIIYSSKRLDAIAYKWKINFNENTKILAFHNVFPELNHNEINGYVNVKGNFHVLLLKDEDDYQRIKKRMSVTKRLIKSKGVPVTEIALSGSCKLAKIFSAIYLGDWTSYFLALRYGTDPTPVEIVEELKKQLV